MRFFTLFGLITAATVFAEPASAALPPASQWIPAEAVAEVEFSKPAAVLDVLLDPQLVEKLNGLPAFKQAIAEPKFQQFLGVVRVLEFQLSTNWATGVRKLIGGGITAAVGPRGETILCLDADDAALLTKLQGIVLGFAAKQPGAATPSEYRGVKVWSTDGGPAHALVENRLLVANRLDVLKAALDLRAGTGRSLATVARYQAAKQAAGRAAVATAYLDLAMVKQGPKFKEALKNDNPLAAMLFYGVTQSLGESSWLGLGLTVEKSTLRLSATVDGKTTGNNGLASFAWPHGAEEGTLPNIEVPRCIAAGTFYRDLHTFYASKDNLFPERTSGLIFFENMMGIFFTGKDLTEEVLSQTRPEIRFVVNEQQYDPAIGTPQVQLPAFAAIFRLRDPKQSAEMTEEAWQKAVGLINFTRGQKAEPGLILDREPYAGIRFTVGRFSATAEKNKTDLPTRYNTQPSIARLGDYLVLSSTERLTREVLDSLQKEMAGTRQATAGTSTVIVLDGEQLSSILGANHKALVKQNMVEKGSTEEQAEAQINLLTIIPKYLGKAKLSLTCSGDRPVMTVELKLPCSK